jgi:hypothetical protein
VQKLTLRLKSFVNALFGGSRGLTEEMKRDLEQRGAIFGDRQDATIVFLKFY